MNREEALNVLKKEDAAITKLGHIIAALSWDQDTAMPPSGADERGEQMAMLSSLIHEKMTSAHSTSIVDIGDYLVISLRGGGGGVANMADGVTVGNISVVDKKTLKQVKELNFENRVTNITRYKDLLIVSLHFHGFYIYKITGEADIISCVLKHIEVEKPRSAVTREFQNSAVFESEEGKINIAFSSYIYGISVYTYDIQNNLISLCSELDPEVFPDMRDRKSGVRNTVFGLTAKGDFVYAGISPGNNRFREQFKGIHRPCAQRGPECEGRSSSRRSGSG